MRVAALSVIRCIGWPLASKNGIVVGLVVCLHDSDFFVRDVALDAIGCIGGALASNDAIVSGLVSCLQGSEDADVRRMALGVIKAISVAISEAVSFNKLYIFTINYSCGNIISYILDIITV